MKDTRRYDTYTIKAKKTKEGFILDSPVVGRTGILKYINADGTERLEYRPPDEAFSQSALESIRGKPITIGHAAMVNSDNADKLPIVGSVISAGRKDGNNIVADVSIFTLPTDARELSCGYTLNLDETPGVTPDGQRYDAVQRDVQINHLAIVPKGRAGNARLNMDGDQVINDKKDDKKPKEKKDGVNMPKVRLDNGLEYDCAPEVQVAIAKYHADSIEAKKKIDTLQAKYDTAEAALKKAKDEAEKNKKNHKEKFDSAVKDRLNILKAAEEYKLDKADAMADKDIKIAIIKKVNGDAIDLKDKSDEYINAAFDMCKAVKHNDAAAKVREKINNTDNKDEDDEEDYIAAMDKLRADEAKAWMGGNK